MELEKYISENIISQLDEKGWDKKAITDKISDFEKERVSMGFEGDALLSSVKQRIKGFFAPILRRNTKSMKAIIYSLSKVEDENDRIRKMSKLKDGTSGYKPNLDYVVQEGFYPWGNSQGEEIPNDKQYEMSGFIGITFEKKMYNKEVRFSGDFLNDKELNMAVAGDVIRVDMDPAKLDAKTNYFSNYKYIEPLNEDKYLGLINNGLRGFHKTISEICENEHKGFTIVKGSVSDIESNNFGFNFDIIDDVDNWDVENSLTGSMKDVTFIDGAEDLLFIGEVYKKGKNQPGYGMNIQKVIVPEKYKKVDLPKENLDTIDESFDTDLTGSTENIDEELL